MSKWRPKTWRSLAVSVRKTLGLGWSCGQWHESHTQSTSRRAFMRRAVGRNSAMPFECVRSFCPISQARGFALTHTKQAVDRCEMPAAKACQGHRSEAAKEPFLKRLSLPHNHADLFEAKIMSAHRVMRPSTMQNKVSLGATLGSHELHSQSKEPAAAFDRGGRGCCSAATARSIDRHDGRRHICTCSNGLRAPAGSFAWRRPAAPRERACRR